MNDARRSVATTAETRQQEARWFERGLPPELLMERVALAAARWVRQQGMQRARIVAGRGHNGADALAIARHLAQAGIETEVAALQAAPSSLAARQLGWALAAGARQVEGPCVWRPEPGILVVDGLLGAGFRGELRPEMATWIDQLQAAARDGILSIDAPSGLDLDTGRPASTAVRATHTLATGVYKRGHFADIAMPHLGKLGRIELGLEPDEDHDLFPRLIRPEPATARSPWLHKGLAGTVLIIGGSGMMAGAPALAGLAALRGGAGLVAIAVPACIRDCVAAMVPEAIVLPLQSWDLMQEAELFAWWSRSDSVVLGPGTLHGTESDRLWSDLVSRPGPPRVVDGGAISRRENPFAESVWTPHPGEAARLLGVPTHEIQEDRFSALEKVLRTTGGTVVLKGACSLVGTTGHPTGVNVVGSAALATAGSGDVLAGLVAAELAAGQPTHAAARRAVTLHGLVGWLAGDRGLLAREIANGIPASQTASRRARAGVRELDLETPVSWALPWQVDASLI